jgi:murein L,D-transpeptidase YafK
MAHFAGTRELMRRTAAVALAVCVAAPATVAFAGDRAMASVTFSDSGPGPEPQLFGILDEIENNRLDKALEKTESLLRQYPNFRLAHLIKGDLLLARAVPLSSFGNARSTPDESLSDLRDEIVARLDAYRSRSTTADRLPRYLLQMSPDQEYAIVIDTQKARLYLYRNDTRAGRPHLVTDYYMSYGKLGTDKTREGDKKTPTGVYHVTSSLNPEKIGDLYGTGAFPINYPNEWDKRQGRKGHGIWLHGTPSDTFSRPPKASDGCMVLANADLDALAKNLQIGRTPVIISNSIEWLSFDDWQNERVALNKKIEEWRSDWESRDIDRYLKHYSQKFATKDLTLEQFAEQKRRVNANKTWIKVNLSNVSMFRNPGQDELVIVTFEQDYRSSNLNDRMKKHQYWIREDGNWKIIFEGAA